MNLVRLLTCATHGDRKWQGHVMCDACGRVFQTEDARKPRAASKTCPCGARLVPPEEEQVGDVLGLRVAGEGAVVDGDGNVVQGFATHDSADWTGRPICYLCYRKIVKEHGGKIPEDRWNQYRAQREGN